MSPWQIRAGGAWGRAGEVWGCPLCIPGTVPCPAVIPQRCVVTAGAALTLGVPGSRGLARARATVAVLQSGCGDSPDSEGSRHLTGLGLGGIPSCRRLHPAPRSPTSSNPSSPLAAAQAQLPGPPQVPSSPIHHPITSSGFKLVPMPFATPFRVTHVPRIRSAIENHHKYAVNLGRLSAIISPEPEGRETACCNVLLFCYMTGLCNLLLSKPSKGGQLSRSLSARPWSWTAPALSRALAGSCGSCGHLMRLAPGTWQGHVTCP